MTFTSRVGAAAGVVLLAASASLTASPAYADASTESPTGGSARAAATALPRYSDLDVVDFLVFARGPIANDKPQLVEQLNMTPVPEAPASVTDQILAELLAEDPGFHEHVTVKAQAGDPYKAEESLRAFSSVVQAVAAKHEAPTGQQLAATAAAANGSVWAFANYVVSVQVALTAAIAVSVAGVVAALVVIAYQRPGESSDMVRESYASAWSRL